MEVNDLAVHADIWGKNVPGRGTRQYKGPKVGAGPPRSRNSTEARVANAEWARERKIGDLVKRASGGYYRDLALILWSQEPQHCFMLKSGMLWFIHLKDTLFAELRTWEVVVETGRPVRLKCSNPGESWWWLRLRWWKSWWEVSKEESILFADRLNEGYERQ